MLCFIHGASQASIFLVRIELVGRWWGVGKATNEPEVKFESHTNTAPLCAESLRPESGILGTVCALRTFKAKHPQGQKHSYSYCGGGAVQETGRITQDDPCWGAREAWDMTHGAVGRNRRRRCAGPRRDGDGERAERTGSPRERSWPSTSSLSLL